jgi:hypothetical protein
MYLDNRIGFLEITYLSCLSIAHSLRENLEDEVGLRDSI